MFKVGDLVRAKDVVGILDGDERGPGHHTHYLVVQLNPDGGVVVQAGDNAHSLWDQKQLEVTTIGAYLSELLAEAKYHLGWGTEKCKESLKALAPDDRINLYVLDSFRNQIHDRVQAALDTAYEEVAEGLFNERAGDQVDFTPPPAAEEWEALQQRMETEPLAPGGRIQVSWDNRPQEIMMSVPPGEPADPWAALIGTVIDPLPEIDDLNTIRKAYVEETNEITLKELAEATGKSLSHLNQLIKRKVLPPGNKVGRVRWMPAKECLEILSSDKEPYAHWPKQEAQPVETQSLWEALI